ncbi:MAG: hypothetical protein OEW15_08715 [Nitrospirota bacterium]|nr:hypothetical protein [Nitrospirota bacterium]
MTEIDLTGYSALIGESFSSKVDLLEKAIGSAHYPSLGGYKERLLANTLRDFLPKKYEVGTGFVLFPAENINPKSRTHFDPHNQSAFNVSKQCDILVFDSSNVPAIFRDDDFVVVRPESVKAMIEVKGSLSITEVDATLESFFDFGSKWRQSQIFYREHHQELCARPGMYVMAWKIQSKQGGKLTTNPSRIRERISNFYKSRLNPTDGDAFPVLNKMLIYNECEIGDVYGSEKHGNKFISTYGWYSTDGRFTRIGQDGAPYRDKDRTIASLLAALHWDTDKSNFNRFFSYTEEVKNDQILAYKYRGNTWAFKLDEGQSNRMTSDLLL